VRSAAGSAADRPDELRLRAAAALRRPLCAPPLLFARDELSEGLDFALEELRAGRDELSEGLDFALEELRAGRDLLDAFLRLAEACALDFGFAARPLPPVERAAPPAERDAVLLDCAEERRLLLDVDRLLREVDGLLREVDGLLREVDGLLREVDGLLLDVDLARARGERERGLWSCSCSSPP
jgi:hypothetical protein